MLELNIVTSWFQQNGATYHTVIETINLLKGQFEDNVISTNGSVNWPLRSCDLTPSDYFLWGNAISMVYVDKQTTLEALEVNINRVVNERRP